MRWLDVEAPSLDDIKTLADEAFANLPAEFRALTDGIAFLVQEFPGEEVIRELDLESEFDILGLFQGPEFAAKHSASVHGVQTLIFLYRRPILDYWAEHKDTLGAIVRHVLIHEIGHHFGLSDEAMHAIENS